MKIYSVKGLSLVALSAIIGLFIACTPNKADLGLGPNAKAGFTITPIPGKVNSYLLTSTAGGAFYHKWDIGDGAGPREGKKVDTAYYAEKGTYSIKLLVLSAGGYDTASQSVTVAADDPNGCFGPKAFLTGCGSRTWILEQPGGGALWVGDLGGGTWWSNGAGDVTGRPCQFNDEWTFKKDGSFSLDVKGDMQVEDEGGVPWPTDIGLPIGCTTMDKIPAKYQTWGSGNFTYKIIGNKIQVLGKGAHLGIYKVGENGTTATPEDLINYDIVELTDTKLVIKKAYSWGQWRFTYRVK